jgi:hypothetical protein
VDNVTLVPSARMALRLRVPCWCQAAQVRVGESGRWTKALPCAFHDVDPTSEPVQLIFDNAIRLYTWRTSNMSGPSMIEGGGVEVHRGPLLYALRPASVVVEAPVKGAPNGSAVKARAVRTSTDAWNYALLPSSLRFESRGVVPDPPFSASAPPAGRVLAQARRVPGWTSTSGARGVRPVPRSPLYSAEPLEEVELVPFGSTNVRISVFPTLAEKSRSSAGPSPPEGYFL